jgi:hypothetical protein
MQNQDRFRGRVRRLFIFVVVIVFPTVPGMSSADDSNPASPPATSTTSAVVPEPSPLAIKQAVPYVATPVPMADVRLTGGPLKFAQDLDAAYLLELEPDRMLYFLRLRAGLMPKGTQHYGGWDGEGGN